MVQKLLENTSCKSKKILKVFKATEIALYWQLT